MLRVGTYNYTCMCDDLEMKDTLYKTIALNYVRNRYDYVDYSVAYKN